MATVKRLLTIVVVVTIPITAACGSSSPTAPPTPIAAAIQAVIFSADFSSLTQAGATAQITALGVLANNSTQDVTPTCTNWRSDNTGVLTVTSTGLMTAQRSDGQVTITTICQGVTAQATLSLRPTSANPA